MKKIIFLVSAGFVICTAFINPSLPPSDYRDSYVGSYLCTSECKVVNSDFSGYNTNTSITTIIVAKDALDSILNVTVHSNVFKIKLKNSNMIPIKGAHRGRFFSTNSISFSFSSPMGVNGCSYKGKKQ
jgi:hypothetical protein